MRRLLAALAAVCVVVLGGCSLLGVSSVGLTDHKLAPGQKFRTQSGLTLVVPQGATAWVSERDPGYKFSGREHAFTERVVVESSGQRWNAAFYSYSRGGRSAPVFGDLGGDLRPVFAGYDASSAVTCSPVASSDSSSVVVYSPRRQSSLRALVDTNVRGAAVGRISIDIHDRQRSDKSLALAREVWSQLHIAGATMP